MPSATRPGPISRRSPPRGWTRRYWTMSRYGAASTFYAGEIVHLRCYRPSVDRAEAAGRCGMNWEEAYRSKICSADEAVELIQSHHRLFMTGNCSVPKQLLAALVRRAPQLEDVEICQVLTFGPAGLCGARDAGPPACQFALYQPECAARSTMGGRISRPSSSARSPAPCVTRICCGQTSPWSTARRPTSMASAPFGIEVGLTSAGG